MQEIYIYKGKQLKTYIENLPDTTHVKRNSVESLINILKITKPQDSPIIAIEGLEGTGKSESIHHIIQELQSYNSTVLIELNNTPIKFATIIRLIEEQHKEIEYIFIDNITYLQDLVHNITVMYNTIRRKHIKLVISTNNKMSLLLATKGNNKCKVHILDTDKIYYSEHHELLNSTLQDYIQHYSLDTSNVILTEEHFKNVLYKAICDNIQQDIVYHNRAKLVSTMSKSNLYSIISKFLHALVYIKSHKKNIKNLDDLQNTKLLSQNVTVQDLDSIVEFLTSIGLLIKVGIGIEQSSLTRYYITNPSIVNYIENVYTGKSGTNSNVSSVTIENLLVTHLYNISRDLKYSLYIEGGVNNLILILERRMGTLFDPVYVSITITLASSKEAEQYIKSEKQYEIVLNNLIITDKPTIIMENNKIQKINIVDFLLNTEEWLKPLINYEKDKKT